MKREQIQMKNKEEQKEPLKKESIITRIKPRNDNRAKGVKIENKESIGDAQLKIESGDPQEEQ